MIHKDKQGNTKENILFKSLRSKIY